KLHHLLVSEPETLGERRAEQGGVIPGELGHGLGQLLQPAVIGEAPIPQRRVRLKEEFELRQGSAVLFRARAGYGLHLHLAGGEGRIRNNPIMEGCAPEPFEVLRWQVTAPVIAYDL